MKYSEELESMIASAVEKGAITDQARNLIVKKALIQGVDPNDLEIYINSLLQKHQQELDKEKEAQRVKYEQAKKDAKGRVCPYCGASLPLLTDKCPNCDQFVTPAASDELNEIIDNLEEALIDFKSGKELAKNKATIDRYARKAKLYYSNNPKIKPLLAEIENEIAISESKAKSIARKEDVKSFLSSRWTWLGIEVLAAVIVFILTFNWIGSMRQENDRVAAEVCVAAPEVIILIFVIYKTAKWAAKGKKK